jgi:hypothetical protein
VPHINETTWATVFVVNQHGIYEEITSGSASDLTQGTYSAHKPRAFNYDFKNWEMVKSELASQKNSTPPLREITFMAILKQHAPKNSGYGSYAITGYLPGCTKIWVQALSNLQEIISFAAAPEVQGKSVDAFTS